MVREYRMPRHIFDDVIAGQRQDLQPEPFDTFAQLHAYCYRVAGVVGLASIYIWGFEGGAETEALAIDRGVAFQLTNILRDLREDAARGRTYLPAEELTRFGATEADLRTRDASRSFMDLMRFQIDRAETYYAKSAPLEECIQADSRPTLVAMTRDLPPAAQARGGRAGTGAAGAGEPVVGQQADDRLAGGPVAVRPHLAPGEHTRG